MSLWRDATPLKRALLAGAPVVVFALVAIVVVAVKPGGDGAGAEQAAAPTPTATPATPTPSSWQVLAYLSAIAPTETPAAASNAGPRNPTSGAPPAQVYVPKPAGTGPGPITGTDMSISIPSIGVNASVYARSVGTNGQMGNPAGAWDVIWYDFSQNYPGIGGYPGTGTSNAVFAGHVDYIRVGPAVFWSVSKLAANDQITVTTANGPITYSVQWSQWAGPADDFTSFVAQTGQDTITLVTCIGGFSAGHYSNRLIVRGVRI
jgi:LPXTG-site transpeptidase (sortase) family protein